MKPFFGARSFALGLVVAQVGCHPWTSEPSQQEDPHERELEIRVVTRGLADPFEIEQARDGALWVTERTGKQISRVTPAGAKTVLITIDEVVATPGAEDGLLGMALHPRLLDGGGNDFVYVSYTYDADPDPDALDLRAKIVRLTYDRAADQLGEPVELLSGLPAGPAGNAGRLVFGPDRHLYFSIGDLGKNEGARRCEPNLAQALPSAKMVAASDWSAYEGKVLRLAEDGSIPPDNPVIAGVRSHVYSFGHRSPEGLAFGPDGKLFAADRGLRTDDEIELVEPGGNHGWPHVAGYRDDQAYAYANWSASVSPPCEELEYSQSEIPGSVPVQKETEWGHPDFRPPLATFYTVPSDHDFDDPACSGDGKQPLCWPTIAPSSLAVYGDHPGWIPGLPGSILVTSAKLGQVLSLKLGQGGLPGSEARVLLATAARLRDLAVSPDGKSIYASTDSGGLMLDPEGSPTSAIEHRGAILEIRPRP